jgi:hypothetical protein
MEYDHDGKHSNQDINQGIIATVVMILMFALTGWLFGR